MKLFSFKIKNHSLGFFIGSIDGAYFVCSRKINDKTSFYQITTIFIGKTFVKEHPSFNKKDTSFYILGTFKICFIKDYFLERK